MKSRLSSFKRVIEYRNKGSREDSSYRSLRKPGSNKFRFVNYGFDCLATLRGAFTYITVPFYESLVLITTSSQTNRMNTYSLNTHNAFISDQSLRLNTERRSKSRKLLSVWPKAQITPNTGIMHLKVRVRTAMGCWVARIPRTAIFAFRDSSDSLKEAEELLRNLAEVNGRFHIFWDFCIIRN